MGKERGELMPSLHLHVLVEMQGQEYVAHCLEMDIVATGPTEEAVKADMIDLIKAQIDFAVQHDNIASIFNPAPPEVWQKLWRAYSAQEPSCQPSKPSVETDFCYGYA